MNSRHFFFCCLAFCFISFLTHSLHQRICCRRLAEMRLFGFALRLDEVVAVLVVNGLQQVELTDKGPVILKSEQTLDELSGNGSYRVGFVLDR